MLRDRALVGEDVAGPGSVGGQTERADDAVGDPAVPAGSVNDMR